MPRLSLYLDDSTMSGLRARALAKNISLSKCASNIIRERVASSAWSESFWNSYGTLDDKTFRQPLELDFALDAKRQAL